MMGMHIRNSSIRMETAQVVQAMDVAFDDLHIHIIVCRGGSA
jgi:hypothetical protein